MSDGGAALPETLPVRASRDFKRRRLGGGVDDVDPLDAGVGAGAVVTASAAAREAYATRHGQQSQQQWNEGTHASSFPYPGNAGNTHGPPAVSHESAPYKPTPAAAVAAVAATAASASALTEGSQWHPSNPSSYPDLASYSQQPYFYASTDSTAYNTAWPPPSEHASQAYGASSAAATNFNVDEHSAAATAATMPFFPLSPRTASFINSDPDVDASAPAFQAAFPSVDVAGTQFALSQQNAAVQAQPPTALGPKQPSSSFYFDDASMHLKIQSLPILDNLATQLIHTISKASYPQVQELMRKSESEESQAYKTLKNLFDQTRKVYSRETPFIDAIAIQMFQPNQQETIRKANIATFISSILGAHDVSFFHLNEFFMETFVPLGHRLLKWQGAVFLELKTQTYISALMNSDGSREAMLDQLFPQDLDAQILTRHPDAPSLSPSEHDFIDRSRQRKSYLLAEPSSKDASKELQRRYQWTDFVREFASYISKNVDGIVNVPVRSHAAGSASSGAARAANATQSLTDTASQLLGRNGLAGAGNPLTGVSSLSLNSRSSSIRESAGDGGSGTSTAPTTGSSSARKPAAATSTIRQPWTKPEEDALLAGLERVNGPHWSQILALYGRGGSVSEVLKDRNQVQLKDKARNLKLWYLKTGKDVPASLQGVTGELRKRGGARARAALGLAEAAGGGGSDDQQGTAAAATQARGSGSGDSADPSLDSSRSAKKKSGGKR